MRVKDRRTKEMIWPSALYVLYAFHLLGLKELVRKPMVDIRSRPFIERHLRLDCTWSGKRNPRNEDPVLHEDMRAVFVIIGDWDETRAIDGNASSIVFCREVDR